MLETLSVVVADDHKLVRDAVESTLSDATEQYQFEVLASVGDGLATLVAIREHRPDLLILDISMPLATGAEIITDIKRWSPDTVILVLTGITTSGLLASMVDSGAHGIFSKTAALDVLISELPKILQGERFIAPELVDAIAAGQSNVDLTDRERQTLNMLIRGKSTKEMAKLLFISAKTVEKHRASVMKKLDVHSTAELLAKALREGMIDPN